MKPGKVTIVGTLSHDSPPGTRSSIVKQAALRGVKGLVKYTIVIEKAPNNYAAVYAPDLPGCVATARTGSRVIQLMREGVAFHLQGLRTDGQPVPPPQATATEVEVALGVRP